MVTKRYLFLQLLIQPSDMDVRALADQDHEVLGEEYCSGYTDSFGKWNTGFYCPNLGNGEPVYCCGTSIYKYCCTKRDEERRPSVDQTALLGIVLGVLLAVVLLTLISCFVCRHCLHFRRRPRAVGGGPLYTMHCSSTASGVANVYSFSAQNSTVTTPIDANEPHVLVNLDCRYPSTVSNQLPVFHPDHIDSQQPHRSMNPPYRSTMPQEPPPPYRVSSPSSTVYHEQEALHVEGVSNPSIMPRRSLKSQDWQNPQY